MKLTRPRHPPQREIDPSALRQQRGGAGHDAVDAVEGEPRLAAEHQRIAGVKPQRAGRIAALAAADAEQAGIAERE